MTPFDDLSAQLAVIIGAAREDGIRWRVIRAAVLEAENRVRDSMAELHENSSISARALPWDIWAVLHSYDLNLDLPRDRRRARARYRRLRGQKYGIPPHHG